ncbi:glycoside hydrolase family 2 protein [Paenibacillus lautus]|uniref:beta-mannosidase n=1 Tax=Paenibacillus lautus TaxID=1401 RepID=UPI002FBE28F8|nr:glycoside hydrolase family 2 protein [Cytobacillus firmus]
MEPKVIDLKDWLFKACDEGEWLTAQVPGCVHTDLFRSGKIPDPFYGTHEHDLQWIDKKDWEYETVFSISEELGAESRLELVFDGLDTYADVYVNGELTLTADNMFRRWRVDIKERIVSGDNRISVRFRSPILEDLPKLERLGYTLPAANDQSVLGGLEDKKVSVFARKAPYHYGWDWGPRFVTSGIWRPCRIEAWSGARISDLYIRQDEISPESAQLTAIVTIESVEALDAELTLTSEGLHWDTEMSLNPGTQIIELPVSITNPKLWWSRGLGEPNLYTFHASLKQKESIVASASVRTGLRSVKLIRDADETGTSFYFELNGIPVYAKGANHIPNDSFLPEVSDERYRHEISSAAEANMNMLRVWGGGIYEADIFYELCDEYGLMVWQDFMFACSMYPGDKLFLANVQQEAEDNLTRLRNHPSIVLWCGNNEIDLAWAHYNENAGWGWKRQYSAELREKIWADYEAIFHKILPEAVARFAPVAEYWPSSPLVSLSRDENQHANPRRTSGDIHYWGVWHNKEPFDNYNVYVGRFMSEYGFQSFPEPKTVKTYADEESMTLESNIMLAHQKHGSGNQLIKSYMDMYTKEPRDFESFLYMSQLQQAEAMKTAIEAHRSRKPYCMGTLYWQMNDCWPVASWSGIDYFGRWKALHYLVKRSFRDVSLVITQKGDTVSVHLISDVSLPFQGTLHLRLFNFTGDKLQEFSLPVQAEAQASVILYQSSSVELLGNHDPAAVVLLAELVQAGATTDSKEHYFVRDKDLKLCAPTVTVTEVPGKGGTTFNVACNSFARQVWLSTETEGIFSDNFFDLIPGLPKMVSFLQRSPGEARFLPSSPETLSVRSLADCVQTESIR